MHQGIAWVLAHYAVAALTPGFDEQDASSARRGAKRFKPDLDK